MMDLKKEAARIAFTMIKTDSIVGLGDGSSIRWLVDYIREGIQNGLQVRLTTSSLQTEKYLNELGLPFISFSELDAVDQYFDGCDQLDHHLNAFKSGAGIHTTEKLLASMAKQFILLADVSKFVEKLENKYPLVIEMLPNAKSYVYRVLEKKFPGISISIRTTDNHEPVRTRYNNYLIDCRFIELPDLDLLQSYCKSIVGVVEISLFYHLAHQAVIVDESGKQVYPLARRTGG